MITLSNEYLVAGFSPKTGNVMFLADPDSKPSLVEKSFFRYHGNGAMISDETDSAGTADWRLVGLDASDSAITSVLETDALKITKKFELPADSPLLKVAWTVKGLKPGTTLSRVAFPCVRFGDGFLNAFEDEEDMYFDGEELGGGMELPCWRVFFREEHRDGLIAAARSKLEMSRFFIQSDHFEIKPHAMVAYDAGPGANPPMELHEQSSWSASFEIGPWKRDRHCAILDKARLGDPVDTGSEKLSGPPAGDSKGIVFDALDFADPTGITPAFAKDKWMRVDMPCCHGGEALFAGPSVRPPALTLDPQLQGVYRIIVGIGNGNGVAIRFSDEKDFTFRVAPGSEHGQGRKGTPFHLRLSGPQQSAEMVFQTAEMDGKGIVLGQFPGSNGVTVIDYVRFEKLCGKEAREWLALQSTEPKVRLSGFFDTTPISHFTYPRDPAPSAYRASLREHANCKIRKVYWRIDGQCSDFPCTTNTMRYVSARVHSVFMPQHKAYGRMLKKVNLLEYAVRAAREYGIELYGWMRFNSYSMNVQSGFYKNNPQYHEKGFDGQPRSKLCIAIPEVRKHKRDILVEAAGYGLAGLNLGFLRHPPMLCYAPILVEGYRKKYGTEPPKPVDPADPFYGRALPPTDEEQVRWFQYRADFLTQFGRELKADLKVKGLDHVKISIWVSARKDLHDGIDTKAWLDQGLCDEVVAEGAVTPAWQKMVREKALLYRGISYFKLDHARKTIPELLASGCDGICTYESDWAVMDTDFVELYRSLRR